MTPGARPKGRSLFAVAVVLCAAFGFWVTAYLTGLSPWLGYASLSRSSFGAGPFKIIGEDSSGTDFGFQTFYFLKGQQIVIAYDAKIRAGSLWFHVFRPYDGVLGDGPSYYVSQSSVGTWTMRVAESGVYHITIDSSPTHGAGRGWDLDYTVWWGANWGG